MFYPDRFRSIIVERDVYFTYCTAAAVAGCYNGQNRLVRPFKPHLFCKYCKRNDVFNLFSEKSRSPDVTTLTLVIKSNIKHLEFQTNRVHIKKKTVFGIYNTRDIDGFEHTCCKSQILNIVQEGEENLSLFSNSHNLS